MSQKAVREIGGKGLLAKWMKNKNDAFVQNFAAIDPSTDIENLHIEHPWLLEKKLVVKPDQLIKRRGKCGLIKLNATWAEAKAWIIERRNKEFKIEVVSGVISHFLIEEFLPHQQSDEYYICIQSKRGGDEILFYHEGGVDVGDVDAKASRMMIADGKVEDAKLTELLSKVQKSRQPGLTVFVKDLITFYQTLHFAYLEINPLVMINDTEVFALDMAAKLDETASFVVGRQWGNIEFPPPFGRPALPQEKLIRDMDSRTGASLKLTVLNPAGRVWTMVAGGGASVIYADTLCDLGAGKELANYGEYSGAPSEEQTFQYAQAILGLMTEKADARGKCLIIGGGIANFTDVAATFKGIIRALKLFQDEIRSQNIKVFVRRGGPNYQEGLELMREVGEMLNIPMKVFGPESHMTIIVSLALEAPIKTSQPKHVQPLPATKRRFTGGNESPAATTTGKTLTTPESKGEWKAPETPKAKAKRPFDLFTASTTAFIYGMQPASVQNMLDFDFICGRTVPSVAAMIYPFTGNHFKKFYWNSKEILIPIYQNVSEAMAKFPDVDVVVNFSSFRGAYESTLEVMEYPQINTDRKSVV